MRFFLHVQARVIVGGLDPIDFRNPHESHLAGALDHEPVGLSGKLLAVGDSFLGAAQSQVVSRVVKRLQEVVERPSLEGFQGVLIVRSHKDDGGR